VVCWAPDLHRRENGITPFDCPRDKRSLSALRLCRCSTRRSTSSTHQPLHEGVHLHPCIALDPDDSSSSLSRPGRVVSDQLQSLIYSPGVPPLACALGFVAGAGHAAPGCVTAWSCGASALLLGPQEREGVVDALVEDLVGELWVGQGAGELQRPDHHGEDAERLGACRGRIVRCQAGGDVVDDGQQAIGVGLLGQMRE
jgi:hypothetical protein